MAWAEAEGQALPGLVRLGVIGVLLQELLESADGGRVELPVVGSGGEVVEIKGRILPLGLELAGEHHQQCEEERTACCEPAKSSSHHPGQTDHLIRSCHAHYESTVTGKCEFDEMLVQRLDLLTDAIVGGRACQQGASFAGDLHLGNENCLVLAVKILRLKSSGRVNLQDH